MTAAQKRFISAMVANGCVVTGDSQVQVHHVAGRKAKHNKVAIGEWFVLPLSIPLHDISSNHPFNVTHWKNTFEAEYGKQSVLFIKAHNKVVDQIFKKEISLSYDDLPPMEVVEAIQNY